VSINKNIDYFERIRYKIILERLVMKFIIKKLNSFLSVVKENPFIAQVFLLFSVA